MPPPAPPIVKLGRTTHGKPEVADDALGVGDRVRVVAARHVEADALHRLGEELAVLALLDDVELRADELDAVLLEHAGLGERHAQFRPVWPPSVGSSASGRSAVMTFSTNSGVIGST